MYKSRRMRFCVSRLLHGCSAKVEQARSEPLVQWCSALFVAVNVYQP